MGAQNSKQTVTINTSQTLNDTASFLQTNSNKISSTVVNYQALSMDFTGAKISGANIQQLQNISVTNQITGTINTQSLTQLSANMASDLQNATNQASTNKPGFYAFGAQNTNAASTVKNALTVAVSRSLTQQNYQKISQSTFNTQTGTLSFNGATIDNTTVTQSQTIVANVIATALVNAVIQETNNVLASQNSNIAVSQTATNAPTGPLQDLKGLISSPGGMTASFVLCVVCIICLVLIGFVWKNGGSEVALKAVDKMPPVMV